MIPLLIRELQLLFTKRKLIAFVLLFAASGYALLIGNLYSGHVVEHIPVAVCDLDGSAESRRLIREIDAVHTYDLALVTPDVLQAEDALAAREVMGVLVIYDGFARDVATRRPAALPFITDGTNALVQSYALGPMQELLGALSAQRQAETAAADGMGHLPPAPVTVSLRIPENPTNSYAFFYVYGVMLTAAQLGIMLAMSESVWQDKHNGFFTRRGILGPLAVKTGCYMLLSTLSTLIGLYLLTTIFDMPFKGSLWDFLPLYLAYAFAVAGLAGLLGVLLRSRIVLVQSLVFYALPAFLLCGYIWPLHGMLPFFRWLSALIPLRYLLANFRAMALSAIPFQTCLADAAVLFFMGALFFAGSALWLKRRPAGSNRQPANGRPAAAAAS